MLADWLFALLLFFGGVWGIYADNDDDNDEEIEKTLAILIGMIAGIALLVIFLSSIRRLCDGKGKGMATIWSCSPFCKLNC